MAYTMAREVGSRGSLARWPERRARGVGTCSPQSHFRPQDSGRLLGSARKGAGWSGRAAHYGGRERAVSCAAVLSAVRNASAGRELLLTAPSHPAAEPEHAKCSTGAVQAPKAAWRQCRGSRHTDHVDVAVDHVRGVRGMINNYKEATGGRYGVRDPQSRPASASAFGAPSCDQLRERRRGGERSRRAARGGGDMRRRGGEASRRR